MEYPQCIGNKFRSGGKGRGLGTGKGKGPIGVPTTIPIDEEMISGRMGRGRGIGVGKGFTWK